MNSDWGVYTEGNLVRVRNRRYKPEGCMYLVSFLLRYDSAIGTNTHVEPPADLIERGYIIAGHTRLPLDDGTSADAWLLRRRSALFDRTIYLFVQSPKGWVAVHPGPGQEDDGPVEAVPLYAEETDGAGRLEYLLQGTADDGSERTWVYERDALTSTFHLKESR